ncbi:tetratricopeptide repeat protein [Campylobacter sp.]
MYLLGDRVEKDLDKAAQLLKKACDGGERSGCGGLGVMYEQGYGVRQDKRLAKEYFSKACDLGEQKLGCNKYRELNR